MVTPLGLTRGKCYPSFGLWIHIVTKSDCSAESDFVLKMISWNICINFDFQFLLPPVNEYIYVFVHMFDDKRPDYS